MSNNNESKFTIISKYLNVSGKRKLRSSSCYESEFKMELGCSFTKFSHNIDVNALYTNQIVAECSISYYSRTSGYSPNNYFPFCSIYLREYIENTGLNTEVSDKKDISSSNIIKNDKRFYKIC